MKQLALVGLEDGDVDVLSRLRRRGDLALAAVYHPDPSALIVRLAGPARLPVVTDVAALCDLEVDLWIAGSAAVEMLDEAGERARAAGRAAPVCIPVAEIDSFLGDPDRYLASRESASAGREQELAAVGAAASHSESKKAAAHAAPATAPAARPPAPGPVVSRTPASQPEHPLPESNSSAGSTSEDPHIRGEEPTTVTRKDVPAAAKSDAHHTTAPHFAGANDREPAGTAQAEASRPAATENDDDEAPVSTEPGSLGNPSMEMLSDPNRLNTWIATSACRVAGGSAAVLWRREADGKRYTLAAFAPGPDAVPGITFPPLLLEEYVRAGRVQAISPDQFVTPDAAPLPFRFLAVPLPGERQAFGLLGVFRPVASGEFPRGGVAELSARAAELGLAAERCFQFARMGQELRGLRFKERLRDLMLESGVAEADRWSRLLRFLLDEVSADFAQFYGLTDGGRRLSLNAVVSRDEEFEGIVSIPVGRGLIGGALERERLSVYAADDHDAKGLYLLPVRARRPDGMSPIGVIVLDGAPDRAGDGQETAGLLEMTGSIIAPLLANLVPPARA